MERRLVAEEVRGDEDRTILAATQREPDFLRRVPCSNGLRRETCTATVVSAPRRRTRPSAAARYTFDGTSWVHVYDAMGLLHGSRQAQVYAPAHSVAYYTPQPGRTFAGSWRNRHRVGPCVGSVIMHVEAYPVATPKPSPFGS